MKKAIMLLAVIFAVTVSPIQTVHVYDSKDIVHNSSGITGMQRADVIVKKFRMHHGLVQYRRWNKTQGCWVDPDWIDFG